MRLDLSPHGELRDALDIEWSALLVRLGYAPVLLSNNGLSASVVVKQHALDAIILTGGNDVLSDGASYIEKRNNFENDLMDVAKDSCMPVLGICRGMQMINLYCGGGVSQLANHVGSDHEVNWNEHTFLVNSYHEYGVSRLADDLIAVAHAQDGSIEAVRHKTLPWSAVMWHPEREIQDCEIHHRWISDAIKGELK